MPCARPDAISIALCEIKNENETRDQERHSRTMNQTLVSIMSLFLYITSNKLP